MLKSLLTTWMGHITINSGGIALLGPILVYIVAAAIKNRRARAVFLYALLAAYVLGMLRFTLTGRSMGTRQVNLTPFWTYAHFSDPQYRWEVYMNIFLFVPFGFLLAFAARRSFRQALLIGLLFSACIEAIQYLFGLGFCETDDVIHNTLGTALGYGYWKLLKQLDWRYGGMMRETAGQVKRCIMDQLKGIKPHR